MKRRLVLLTAVGMLLGPQAARAQFFGQNKVQYRSFDWHVIQTTHLEVHYYGEERQAALDAARMAERSYARLSRILQHEWQEKKPLILYASNSDFTQTNTTPGDLGEGTGGFTDFLRNRMVLPFTGSYADFEHVLMHEMVHAFQYDVFSRGRAGAGMSTIMAINPPLWFMEGMAEYLSIGPVDNHTSMWMRDAAIHGRMPSIEQLTYDPRFFPYRFGHSLWAYVGQKWGDESVGAILQGTLSGGIDHAFERVLGVSLVQLGEEWVEAVQNTYLPQIPSQQRPRAIARQVLSERTAGGSLHVSPQVSPDGEWVVYLSERNFFFVDLYIADVRTGRQVRKLVGSALNANFESLRFINSAGGWSPDGRDFAFVSKNRGQDVINILDVRRRDVRRILRLGFAGIVNPSYSPDGQQIVFTGLEGGWSDLYIVNADGSDLRRLTNDPFAELMPSWSPDGSSIAFTTDRGPDTDFQQLRFGNLRIALYHLDGDSITILRRMDEGKNINPVWAPDGRSLAFLSTRSGISNVFLYDFATQDVYQLSRAYTGITGITDLSPAISWARDADRILVTYYEDGAYNVYAVDNPRSLRQEPFRSDPAGAIVLANASAQPLRPENALGAGLRRPGPLDVPLFSSLPPAQAANPATLPGPTTAPAPAPSGGENPGVPGSSIYRIGSSLRPSDTPVRAPNDSGAEPPTLSVAALLDSAELALPDTTEFTIQRYEPRYTADFVSRPTIGYARDNFGRGFFGGAAIQLADMLGDHVLSFSGAINGRIAEAQVYAAYTNMAHRWNWSAGVAQDVWYYYAGASQANLPNGESVYNQAFDRWIARQGFLRTVRPFSRFQRLELNAMLVNMDQSTLNRAITYDANGIPYRADEFFGDSHSILFGLPSAALVYDNTLMGYTSIFYGQRYRFQIGQAVGGYEYTEAVADYRKYFSLGFPWTFAIRFSGQGRFGKDENLFPIFIGSPDRVRGYTYGSYIDDECDQFVGSLAACSQLDQLIGSRMMVTSAEFRFPLFRGNALGFVPVGLPPVEGAIWADAGLAWSAGNKLSWSQPDPTNPNFANYRAPFTSWGASVRLNLFGFAIFNVDYAMPQQRNFANKKGYWILSLNPPF